ncbi:MAG: hypothetical protein JO284_04240 [Planctomycetaceae bacterium]|nr:hypothetical protein [Planctomycetaceae bacterium]
MAEEVTVVVVAAWLTVWVRAVGMLLVMKLLSPLLGRCDRVRPDREGRD